MTLYVNIHPETPQPRLLSQAADIVRNGGIAALLETSPAERAALVHLEEMDRQIMGIRDRLRSGQRIEALAPLSAALSASLPAP